MILRLARLGGLALIAGSIALLLAGALALGNRAVGVGFGSIGGVVVDAGVVLVAVGASLLAAAGQGPAAGIASRLGLVILAFGMLANLASSFLVRTGDMSVALPVLVLQLGVAIPAAIVGWLVIGIGLFRKGGRPRLAGRAFLGGVALLPVLAVLTNLGDSGLRFDTLAAPIGGLAFSLLIGAMGGLGYLALSDRWSWR